MLFQNLVKEAQVSNEHDPEFNLDRWKEVVHHNDESCLMKCFAKARQH
jgi:hypothetical protein